MAVLGNFSDPVTSELRILTGGIAMICFGFGINWLLSTLKIFEGLGSIREILSSEGTVLSDDRITCLIVRMLAYYRDKRRTIRTKILVNILGGVCFLLVGIAASLNALSVVPGSIMFIPENILLIPGMICMFGIAIASFLSSYYLLMFTRVYDQRLQEINKSECALQEKLGLDES